MNIRYTPTPGSDAEKAAFTAFQRQLAEHFDRFANDPTRPYTAVVIPSQSFDPTELAKIDGVAHYEERSLFNLMLLRHPRLKMIYVTSKPLNPLIVDYYLHHLRGVPSSHARRRLTLLDCDDTSPRPLTQKVLERPHLVARIRAAIDDGDAAHMACFNSTALERTLSVQLGIPLNACDPELAALGTKTGSRAIFKEAGVAMAPGRSGLRDSNELIDGVVDLWRELPATRRIVVKLNDSFSGEGNAILKLDALAHARPDRTSPDASRSAVAAAMHDLQFEAAGLQWPQFASQFDGMGGICEVWVEGEGKASPSVQVRINPVRQVQVVSTHDQMLGGPGGQVFLGATFPADPRYRMRITHIGRRIGEVMAAKGVIGRFGIDFLYTPHDDGICAVEINLRQGGTTHPFNTLKFLTAGKLDEQTGSFVTAQGSERCYFATDTLQSDRYRGLLPVDLLDLLVVNGVHVRADDSGVVFHLMGCLSQFGKVGCTAIAGTVQGARALYAQTVQIIDKHTAPVDSSVRDD